MIVMKFGGTSVADRPAIERLIAIVRAARQVTIQPESSDWRGPVVVVSAIGGATDRLLGIAAEAGAGDLDGARANVGALRDRHLDLSGIVSEPSLRADVESFIRSEFSELERVAGALSVLREVTPRWLDAIAAVGEIVSSRIVAAALSSHGISAKWIDARRVMVTDGEHTEAAPLMTETGAALAEIVDPVLADRRVPVTGGFVGATRGGVTTTLGRGGSDYSASIIGACLGASEIQIWTDVDGMLTADPRIVSNVHVVPHLSFAEASELSYFGAKVLHPATIVPAVGQNIPVRILNSRRPIDAEGTLITRERPKSDRPLTAVASKTGVTVVDITSTRMLMAHGFLRRIFEVFEQHQTSVDVVTTSEVSVSVTIDDTRYLSKILDKLKEVADVTREDDMAVVCAVGEGLQNDPTFVGLDNYRDILSDEDVWHAMQVTAHFVVWSIALQIVIGFGLALLINRQFRSHSFWTTLILLPMMLSPAVVGNFWTFLLQPQIGLFNYAVSLVTGIDPSSFQMIGDVQLSPWAIILVDTWMWSPYVMLICLAGLRSIPDYIYEAAEVDRASPWRQFWSITLPMVLPFLMLAVLFRAIENFKMFDMVNLLTSGGPGSITELASITLKREAFEKWRTGYSSAFAVILFVTVFGAANIYVRVLNKVKQR